MLAVAGHLTVVVVLDAESFDVVRRLLLIGGYALAMVFVWVNRSKPSIMVLGLGLVLNLAPVVANGGLMPVLPETLEKAGAARRVDGLEPGDPVPHTKDVLMSRDEARLELLGDRLVLPRWMGNRAVVSVGDIFVAAGFVLSLPLAVRALGRVEAA